VVHTAFEVNVKSEIIMLKESGHILEEKKICFCIIFCIKAEQFRNVNLLSCDTATPTYESYLTPLEFIFKIAVDEYFKRLL
jgi:hypothetical protein